MATQIFSQKYQALPICSRTINIFVCLIDRVKSIVWFWVLISYKAFTDYHITEQPMRQLPRGPGHD